MPCGGAFGDRRDQRDGTVPAFVPLLCGYSSPFARSPLASASFPRWSTSRNQPAWDTLGAFIKAPSELGLGYFAQTEETGELRVNNAGNPVDNENLVGTAL